MFVSFQEKVILTQNFRRQTLQQNKISFEFSLKKNNWNKNYTLQKGFHQRWKCLNNATNIKHKTEVHDIKTIEIVHCLN